MIQASLATMQPSHISHVFVATAEGRGDELPAFVQKMLPFFDGRRTVEQICEELQISVSKGQAIVGKLTELGILRLYQGSSTATSLSGYTAMARSPATEPVAGGFSEMEEEFFATELTPIDEADLEQTVGERLTRFVCSFLGLAGAWTSLAR